MTKINDALQLCDDIDDGEYDDALDDIRKAVLSRNDIVTRRTARRLQRSLAIGDRVKLTNGIKPRYYEGMVGSVTKLVDGAAVVNLDKMPTHSGAGRPSTEQPKQRVKIPLANLVKIKTKAADEDDVADLDDAVDPDDIGDDHDEDDD